MDDYSVIVLEHENSHELCLNSIYITPIITFIMYKLFYSLFFL